MYIQRFSTRKADRERRKKASHGETDFGDGRKLLKIKVQGVIGSSRLDGGGVFWIFVLGQGTVPVPHVILMMLSTLRKV